MNRTNIYRYAASAAGLLLVALLCGCAPKKPQNATRLEAAPHLYPDVAGVTIPVNIAPLTFTILDEGSDFVTSFTCDGTELLAGGKNVEPDEGEWKTLLTSAKGKEVTVQVYRKNEASWQAFAPFTITVSPDSIDPYISYRLISPSYVSYEKLTLNQRELATYDEKEIYNNMLISRGEKGQCINCHSYKAYGTSTMQFHARQTLGGTLFVIDGKMKKVNLKNDSTLSAGVYPAFNPCYNVIAYSVNTTWQTFHMLDKNKVEVQDSQSDLILYDYDKNEITTVRNDPNELEVFPTWSPDGKTLYFCSAHVDTQGKTGDSLQILMLHQYRDILYNIYKVNYNPQNRSFSQYPDTVFAASKLHKSATFPRVSPDGHYVLFAMGDYGCFHIWHNSADLYVKDLVNDTVYPLAAANSPRAESYHSWSSNGRWILFASRRDDGDFSRLYISYFDRNGVVHKPFMLPQQSPEFYHYFYKSYNVPEFMKEPVRFTPQEFATCLKGEAVKATYNPQR